MGRRGKRKLKVESQAKNRPKYLHQEVGVEEVSEERVVDASPFDINPELTRRRAKELYLFYGYSKKKLMEELGIPESTLDVWLYQPTRNTLSWKQEREDFQNTVMARMRESRAEELSDSLGRLASIVKRSVTEMDLEGQLLKNPRQVKDMLDAMGKLDSIIKLEEGKPTSISGSVELTQKEAEKLVEELQSLDPFLDYDPKGKIN